jgi:hypothetical protein
MFRHLGMLGVQSRPDTSLPMECVVVLRSTDRPELAADCEV